MDYNLFNNNDEWTNGVIESEKNLIENFDNEIVMYKVKIRNKNHIVISGLMFATVDERKKFIKNISKQYGINCTYKINEKFDKNKEVFIFTGDYRNEIKNYLAEYHKKDINSIKFVG